MPVAEAMIRRAAGKKIAAMHEELQLKMRDMGSMATQKERAACLKGAKELAERVFTEVLGLGLVRVRVRTSTVQVRVRCQRQRNTCHLHPCYALQALEMDPGICPPEGHVGRSRLNVSKVPRERHTHDTHTRTYVSTRAALMCVLGRHPTVLTPSLCPNSGARAAYGHGQARFADAAAWWQPQLR